MKEVLYLSYTGMTDPLGQSQVLAYLEGLTKTGIYSFTIISFEKKEAYARNGIRVKGFCDKIGISWYPLNYTKRPPVISTFIDTWRMKRLARKLNNKEKFDLVHCRSYIPSLAGLELKKKTRIPFLFDMRGFWADERIDGNIWKKSNPLFRNIYNYFKRKEKDFLVAADHVVSLTQNAKNEILSWRLTAKPLDITVIPCCADTSLFNPNSISHADKNLLRKELNIPSEATVISYVGSLGTWYMLGEMISFVKKFIDSYPNTFFLLLTGEPETMITEAANRHGLSTDCIRIKRVDRAQMPLHISISNVSLFFIKPAYSKKASSPVKQGELMAMGVPIVCNASIGDTDKIIKDNNAGIVLNGFSDKEYETAIFSLKRTNFDSEQIRQGAIDYFSLDKGVSLYRSVYENVLGK